MAENITFSHMSERAAAVISNGGRVFNLALPRSNRNPLVTEQSEGAARMAAAKLCQQHGMRILDVWKEFGEHDDWGLYTMYYIVVGKAH